MVFNVCQSPDNCTDGGSDSCSISLESFRGVDIFLILEREEFYEFWCNPEDVLEQDNSNSVRAALYQLVPGLLDNIYLSNRNRPLYFVFVVNIAKQVLVVVLLQICLQIISNLGKILRLSVGVIKHLFFALSYILGGIVRSDVVCHVLGQMSSFGFNSYVLFDGIGIFLLILVILVLWVLVLLSRLLLLDLIQNFLFFL